MPASTRDGRAWRVRHSGYIFSIEIVWAGWNRSACAASAHARPLRDQTLADGERRRSVRVSPIPKHQALANAGDSGHELAVFGSVLAEPPAEACAGGAGAPDPDCDRADSGAAVAGDDPAPDEAALVGPSTPGPGPGELLTLQLQRRCSRPVVAITSVAVRTCGGIDVMMVALS